MRLRISILDGEIPPRSFLFVTFTKIPLSKIGGINQNFMLILSIIIQANYSMTIRDMLRFPGNDPNGVFPML
jgi:hypothetical protein